MATGKTTVGKLLAERLNYHFVDTDALIERRAGCSIADIFAESGESTFRQWEAAIAQELAQETGQVIATGGGMLLKPANVTALAKNGVILCLTATPETIFGRITNDTTRPLLTVPDRRQRILALLQERQVAYQQFPQIHTDDLSPPQIVEVVMRLLEARRKNSKQT